MIRNIVFDIGNVLVDFAWEKYFNSFGFTKEIVEKISKATVLSPQWAEFDRSSLSYGEIVDQFVAVDPSVEKEIRLVCADLHDMLVRREETIPWIQELKSNGYRVFYLSNYSQKAKEDCADTLDFIPYMDGGILSCDEGLIKPDPAIYQRLLAKYDLVAEECVFLDDSLINCQAAEKEGFYAIHFTDKEDAVCRLKKLGVA